MYAVEYFGFIWFKMWQENRILNVHSLTERDIQIVKCQFDHRLACICTHAQAYTEWRKSPLKLEKTCPTSSVKWHLRHPVCIPIRTYIQFLSRNVQYSIVDPINVSCIYLSIMLLVKFVPPHNTTKCRESIGRLFYLFFVNLATSRM